MGRLITDVPDRGCRRAKAWVMSAALALPVLAALGCPEGPKPSPSTGVRVGFQMPGDFGNGYVLEYAGTGRPAAVVLVTGWEVPEGSPFEPNREYWRWDPEAVRRMADGEQVDFDFAVDAEMKAWAEPHEAFNLDAAIPGALAWSCDRLFVVQPKATLHRTEVDNGRVLYEMISTHYVEGGYTHLLELRFEKRDGAWRAPSMAWLVEYKPEQGCPAREEAFVAVPEGELRRVGPRVILQGYELVPDNTRWQDAESECAAAGS